MLTRSLVVVAILSGPAAAEFDQSPPRDIETVAQTPRLRIGQPGAKLALDKVAVTIEQDALGVTAKVKLSVSTSHNTAGEAVMAIEVPHGARITGVALTIGKTQRMVAAASGTESARVAYENVLMRGRDPVLAQWKAAGSNGDVIEVRAFPLTTTERGQIELTIELPTMSALTVDTIAPSVEVASVSHRTYRKVTRPITIEVPQRRELALPLATVRPAVSETTSFYAGFAPTASEVPIVFISGPHYSKGCFSADKTMIRRQLKRQSAKLQYCYERAYTFNPIGGPDADAVLHFTIDPAGKITDTSISGTIEEPAILTCLANVVAQLEFGPGDVTTQVNYPLHFRLNR